MTSDVKASMVQACVEAMDSVAAGLLTLGAFKKFLRLNSGSALFKMKMALPSQT